MLTSGNQATFESQATSNQLTTLNSCNQATTSSNEAASNQPTTSQQTSVIDTNSTEDFFLPDDIFADGK